MEYIILAIAATSLLFSLIILIKVFSKKNNTDALEQARRENEALKNMILSQNSELRKEVTNLVYNHGKSTNESITQFTVVLQNQMKDFSESLRSMSESNQKQLEQLRQTVENNIRSMQTDNAEKLEKMRETVDEKLNSTLEKRLSESFANVSKQLESVYKGLGEMQTLASSVGDLKNALTNVKVRGTWGEVSLDNLLEQILTSEQYKRNVRPNPRSNNIVEFCICLPNGDNGQALYLPIDCKFPIEQYLRLCDATEKGDLIAADEASRQLEQTIKKCAREIRDKYIIPPYTTDFAIMYLPIEGLYAEVARKSGLCEQMQREYRVTIAGPTTLGAFLNSLQLGFKTLAIQKRTSEITSLLTKIRFNFGKFAELLEKTKKKLDDASNNIEDATKRYYSIDKLLNKADAFENTDNEPFQIEDSINNI